MKNRPSIVEVPYTVFCDMLTESFRYCLGRRTYVVSGCVDNIIKYWDILNCYDQRGIQRDIKAAIEQGHAGMSMDVEQWEKVLKLERKFKQEEVFNDIHNTYPENIGG